MYPPEGTGTGRSIAIARPLKSRLPNENPLAFRLDKRFGYFLFDINRRIVHTEKIQNRWA
jgi:hypothetical protein